MRIAALTDIHGNLPALEAVLAELDTTTPVEAIVVGGDVVAGPFVREVLELLRDRPEPVHWVRGNSERETVAAFDGDVPEGLAGPPARWSADALDREWRDELDSWPIFLSLDGVMFCHGSPRRDDEFLTRVTPDEAIVDALGGVTERLVIGGHTHQQFRRGPYVNAGSVGLPYEGRPGAFWVLVNDGVAEFRETAYDVEDAVERMLATGYPDDNDLLRESLLEPADPGWVARYFEFIGGRGEDPGPPPSAGRSRT